MPIAPNNTTSCCERKRIFQFPVFFTSKHLQMESGIIFLSAFLIASLFSYYMVYGQQLDQDATEDNIKKH